MISQIRGTLVSRDTSSAVIDVNGIGLKVGMPTSALAGLGGAGATVTLATSLIVKADALDLYGFEQADERDFFERLLTVSGVGPKLALSALSAFSAGALQQLIIAEDVKQLSTVPGLGKKTAQRLILDLKGTLAAIDQGSLDARGQASEPAQGQVRGALLGMGFTAAEIDLALKGYSGAGDDVSLYLRYALQRLGGGS